MISFPRMLLAMFVGGILVAKASLAQQIDISGPPYNADMTGATDGTAALNSAIAAAIATGGPRAVYIPAGTLKITSTIAPASAVRILGAGTTGTSTPATTIKWGGASGATMIRFAGMSLGGHGVSNLMLDGNSMAGTCLIIDGSVGGYYQNLRVSGFTVDAGITMTATASGASCSSNQLTNIHIDSSFGAKCALWLTGDATNGGSSSHNEFHNLTISISGASDGIWLNGNNNDRFYSTFIYDADGSSGAGVRCTAKVLGLEGYGPTENGFYFLEASRRGWVNDTGLTSMPATVYGYQLSNGEPLPVWNGVLFPIVYGDGTAQFITLNASSGSFSGALTASAFTGNGAGLTGFVASQIPPLDFSRITTGIVPKAQLPAVTIYSDAVNTFSQPNNFDVNNAHSLTLTALANPSAPSVARIGSAGSSTWSYKIVAKLSDGTTATAASPAATLSTGFATLSATNYNAIAWSPVAGATFYDVYRTATGTSPSSTGRIASNLTVTSYNDQGAVGNGSTAPGINATGALNGSSIALSGNQTIGGTLGVTGNSNFSGSLGVTGNVGFYGATPIAKPSGNIFSALSNIGLVDSPSLNYSDISNRPSVCVEEFGAVGDGVTDDTAAIQRAIDSFLGKHGGGVVSFGCGVDKVYKVNGTIYLHGNVTLDGGRMTTTIANASDSASATVQVGDDSYPAEYCRITGLRFLPSLVRNANTYEISLYKASATSVDHVAFGDQHAPVQTIWGCLKVGRLTDKQGLGWFDHIHAHGFENFAYIVWYQTGFFSEIVVNPGNTTANVFILEGGAEGNFFDHIESTGGGSKNVWLRTSDCVGQPCQNLLPRFNMWSNSELDSAAIGVRQDNGDMNSFVSCWFSNTGNGVLQNGGSNLKISQARMSARPDGSSLGSAIVVNGGNDLSVIDTLIREWESHGIAIGNGVTGGVNIKGGHFFGNRGNNIFIGSGVTGVNIDGVKLEGAGGADIVNGSPNGVAIVNPHFASGTPISTGYYPPETTVPGVYAGLISNIPSWLLADGTASHNWITENNSGVLRWLFADAPAMTLSATQLAVNGVIKGQSVSGSGDVLMIGNDSKLLDIDVANTAGLYGQSDSTKGQLKLGSAGPYLSGASGTLTVNGNEIVTGNLTVNGTITQSEWVAAPLTNSWVNYGGGERQAQYRKDALGRVELRGFIKDGENHSGDIIFQLPAGWRPTAREFFHVMAPGGADIRVEASGEVRVDTPGSASTYLSISGISFSTD